MIRAAAAARYQEQQQRRRTQVQALPSASEVSDAVLSGRQRIHDLGPRPDIVNVQDNVIQEGQGPIADRTQERLGRTDAPVILCESCGRASCARWPKAGRSPAGRAPRAWRRRLVSRQG